MAAPAPRTQQEIRRHNLSRVLYAVADHGPVSRAAVATRIGLTRTAVSTLVDELLRAGLLVEQGRGRSGTVGRPGTDLALTDRGPCGLGAEIGVDHLAVCAVDLRGTVRARLRVPAANRHSEPTSVLARLARLVRLVTDQAREAELRPAGLAVAVPGLVARGTTTVVHAPNLGWRNVDLAAHLGTDLTVDNEANLGALAELWLGAPHTGDDGTGGDTGDGTGADGAGDFVHVSAENGIGAALVVGGELLRGSHGFGGEIGHVPVWPQGRPCACGARGCLEQYAGERAVLAAAGLRPGPDARIELLADRAEQGDAAVLRALREAGTALGIALAGAVNLLDPGRVNLGGALARVAPWLRPALERELERRTTVPRPALTVSRLGPDGPLLGAAHAARRAVLDDPLAHRL